MSRIVVALGGNALLPRSAMDGAERSAAAVRDRTGRPGSSAGTQAENVALAADILASLTHHELAVTHGNGPQVGLLALQAEAAGSGQPLDVLGAETEGMIGYLLEREIRSRISDHPVVTLLTQVEVDPDDPSIRHPTKPIGPGYDAETGRRLARERGWSMVREEDSGGEDRSGEDRSGEDRSGEDRSGEGRWRRVVPSPRPVRILELDAVRLLLDRGYLVVCGGGGGIPVVRTPDGSWEGVDGVVDKDRLSSLLGLGVGADQLLLLTDERAVYRDWPARSRPVERATPAEIRALNLPAGSMGPKVEAAADFVEAGGGVAAIGALEDAADLLAGRAGTRIVAE